MNNMSIGSTWGIWDLQVQTILDDRYISLKDYYKKLKDEDITKWEQFTALVGGEENALLFDSKTYFNDKNVSEDDRCNNYSRNLFSFLKIYRPSLSLVGFTDHNYFNPKLIDALYKFSCSDKCPCKSLCGVEINVSGIHMLVFFEKPPYLKEKFSDGIITFLNKIGVDNPKTDGFLSICTLSVNQVIEEINKQSGLYIFPHCYSNNGLFTERNESDRTALAKMYNADRFVFLQGHSKENVEKVESFINKKKHELLSKHIFSIASDSRKLDDIGKPDKHGNYFWLKGRPNFRAFKHVSIEKDRAFIGEEPDLMKRVKQNSTKFIKSIHINKISSATISDVWFHDFNLELNSGLVAIIGNKGSGKSAITDIISLCANTNQKKESFSFLTDKKFRSPKPYNLSQYFEAKLTWHDGSVDIKNLKDNPNPLGVSKVKYLPQSFIETICNNLNSDVFENELKEVIYSHTPFENRLGRLSLDDLISYKSDFIINEIKEIQFDITKINIEIIDLESKSNKDYKITLESKLDLKNKELEAHEKNAPQMPLNDGLTVDNQELVARLNKLRFDIESLEKEERSIIENKKDILLQLEELDQFIKQLNILNDLILKQTFNSGVYLSIISKYGFVSDDLFSYKIDTQPILDKIDILKSELLVIDSKLDLDNTKGLSYMINLYRQNLKVGQEELDKPARDQQKYHNDNYEWAKKRDLIIGNADTEDSIEYFKKHIQYLEQDLTIELDKRIKDRNLILNKLLLKKYELVKIRKDLFVPITDFIENYKELNSKYNVKIDVNLEMPSFESKFLSFINQSKIGSFQGQEEGRKKIQDLIEACTFDNIDDISVFISTIMDLLNFDKRSDKEVKLDVKNQLSKNIELIELYDYIFHFDYLRPVYNLKLGDKDIKQLSPGERGALLLIFYLILDIDDIPLIIDQPEENLDNESVYQILVHFIKKVKEQRQIIMVTHNPNLAIVCDADQIVHMAIEKNNKNKVSFKSGGIEETIINKSVIDILEGTFPAFNNRNLKYLKSEFSIN